MLSARWSWCVALAAAVAALTSDQRSSAQAPFDPSQAPASVVPTDGTWRSVGPTQITDGTRSYSGRVTTIAVDPTDSNHWLIGAAQGGVWESTDGGANWTPRTDAQVSLAMGALAFSLSSPAIVYAGTGEGNFSDDSYAGGGLLKSTDGGATWSLVSARFARSSVTAIRVDPRDPDVLVAATTHGRAGKQSQYAPLMERGIFRSVDGGATWSLRLSGPASDIAVNPQNFSQQYAAIGLPSALPENGIYRSSNGGVTWNLLSGPWTALTGGVGRVAFAVAPSNPDVVYVSIQDAFNGQATDGQLLGLWVTSDAWAATPTWTPIDAAPASGYCGSRCDRDHVLSVDPANPGVLYVGGASLWRYSAGTWTSVSSSTYSGQHALAWADTRLIAGNDGGVFSTTNNGATWTSHNTNLAITQFYAGSLHPFDPHIALGGAQNNGTVKWTGAAAWPTVFNNRLGDGGGYSVISSSAPDTKMAVTTRPLSIWRTTDGVNFSSANGGMVLSSSGNFAQFAKCPWSDDIMLAAPNGGLWKTTNFFSSAPSSPTWNAYNNNITGITAIAFAPSDPNCETYAVASSDTGTIWITSTGGGTWFNMDALHSLPARAITSLVFHPLDPNRLYVTVSGFDESSATPGHVFRTANAFAVFPTWTNISPPVNLPANAVALTSSMPAGVFVGSDIGMWSSGDGGDTWTFLGPERGLPNVAVFDIKIDEPSGRVMAFTHGRGAFVLDPPVPVSVTPNSGSGSTQTFSAQYVDGLGAADLTQVFLRFSVDLGSQANLCLVRYNQTTGSISLRDDAGMWLPSMPLPGAGVLQNSQCAVDVGASSVSMAGNTLTLNAAVEFNASYAGLKNTYLQAQSATGTSSGWKLRGTWNVSTPVVNVISVSPNNASGITQLFTLAYADSAGVAADLSGAMVRFTNIANPALTCTIHHRATTGQVRIMDDAGVWGPWTPYGSSTLSNSRCSLDLATSSATPSGSDLSLALNITFLPAFAGPATISMRAQSVSRPNTGWVPKGTWTVGGLLDAVSIAPNSGTGASRNFSAVFTDSLGVTSDLRMARVRFGASTVSACVVDYNAMTNMVRILDDAAAPGAFGPFSGTLSNSQCTVDLSQSSATASGTTLTLALKVTFKAALIGQQPIFLRANGNFGNTTGWVARGTWNVNAVVQAISVTPNAGSGPTQTFVLAFSDSEGVAADLAAARVRLRNAAGRQCAISYDAMTTLVRVQDDLGNWSTGVPIGSATTINNNSQCWLDVAQSSAAASGSDLTLTLRIAFKSVFAGETFIDMRANSDVGSTTGWVNKGTWTVLDPLATAYDGNWIGTNDYSLPASMTVVHGIVTKFVTTMPAIECASPATELSAAPAAIINGSHSSTVMSGDLGFTCGQGGGGGAFYLTKS